MSSFFSLRRSLTGPSCLRSIRTFKSTSFNSQQSPKRILARNSRFQITNPYESKHHRRIKRLLKRLSEKEKALGFYFVDGRYTSSPSSQRHDMIDTSLSVLRLYNEISRPRQVSIENGDGWDVDTVSKRAENFWEHILESVDWKLEGPPPSIFNARVNSLLSVCRPSTMSFLDHATNEFKNIKTNNECFDLSLYGSLVAKTLWCSGVEEGYTILTEAEAAGALGNSATSQEEFYCHVASHLGEGVADFNLLVNLTQRAGVVLTPSMYAQWLLAIKSRRGDNGHHFDFAQKYLEQPQLEGFGDSQEIKNALIQVAVHDRSSQAIASAFNILSSMSPAQTPSTHCLNAMTSWCANQRPSRSSMRFGDTHARLVEIENAMVSTQVKPSPRILGNLIAGYAFAGDAVSVLSIYRNMKMRGISLNVRDFTFLIHSISNAAIPTPATWQLLADPTRLVHGLFEEVIGAGYVINTNLLNAGLRIFMTSLRVSQYLNQRASSFEKETIDFEHITASASSLFREMVEGTATNPSVRPNYTTFKYMIKILCLSGDNESAIQLLAEMKSENIDVDVKIYNLMFEFLSSSDWRMAEDLFIVMTNNGIKANSNTMDAFLKGSSKSGSSSKGFSMVQGCFNQYQVRPSKHCFFNALAILLEGDDHHEAQRIAAIYRQLWPDEEGAYRKAVQNFTKRFMEKKDTQKILS